jgi:hypothetical protein
MKTTRLPAISIILLAIQLAATAQTVELFNGKNLDGWKFQLDPKSDAKPESVFSVQDGVIAISGQPFGYMYTDGVYDNYRLHVEWRYTGKGSNSGIFLFVQEAGFWPNAIECQLQSGRAGDFIQMGGAKLEKDPAREDFAMFNPSQENPVGEWNNADILCENGLITVHINGTLQNKALTAGRKSGRIALQSEGGPLQFRHIRLTPLEPVRNFP